MRSVSQLIENFHKLSQLIVQIGQKPAWSVTQTEV